MRISIIAITTIFFFILLFIVYVIVLTIELRFETQEILNTVPSDSLAKKNASFSANRITNNIYALQGSVIFIIALYCINTVLCYSFIFRNERHLQTEARVWHFSQPDLIPFVNNPRLFPQLTQVFISAATKIRCIYSKGIQKAVH